MAQVQLRSGPKTNSVNAQIRLWRNVPGLFTFANKEWIDQRVLVNGKVCEEKYWVATGGHRAEIEEEARF